ncbi:MAG TPA: class I SAM-dependent methyltransferase [Candidatus Hydrogenedentes bacterium]|nr:class I SAM-dependent methyltransferase [Candidatus Hydrogenedentota bacterium]
MEATIPIDLEKGYAKLYALEEAEHFVYWGRQKALGNLVGGLFKSGTRIRALDIGCGTGYILTRLQSRGAAATGIECNPVGLAMTKRRGIRRIVNASAGAVPFAAAAFNLVLALDVYEHIADDVGAMREAFRILEPGGSHVVFVPASKALWGKADVVQGHRRRYSRRELAEKLRRAGFSVRRITRLLPTLFLPALIARTAERLFSRLRPDWEPNLIERGVPPRWLNAALQRLVRVEARLAARYALPFGVTLVAVAAKESDSA